MRQQMLEEVDGNYLIANPQSASNFGQQVGNIADSRWSISTSVVVIVLFQVLNRLVRVGGKRRLSC